MLQGTGFVILYCALAIPLGAVADATDRRNLIVLGLTLCSAATAAAAFADSFATLLATRVLVGMGEACLIPAGMSLLAAYFAPSTPALGTSIFGLGANLGLAFAFLASAGAAGLVEGTAAQRRPCGLCQHDAGRRRLSARQYAELSAVPAGRRDDGGHRLCLGQLVSSIFVRIHGMTATEAGGVIGTVGFVAGSLGTIAGGIALDALRRRKVAGAPMLLMAVGAVFALIFATVVVFAPSRGVAIAGYALFVFESTFIVTLLYVGMQMLTPDGFRGIATSFNMMTYTLAGLGRGPIAVGAISVVVGGARSLAWGIVGVEAAMCSVVISAALMCRSQAERRARSVRAAD